MPIVVNGEGPLNCDIALVGEALGEEEQKRGRPFVGKAGNRLDLLLQVAGINRSRCRIENVVKERPYDNDISQFIQFNRNGTVSTTPEYDRYEQELYQALSNTTAKVIVPLGRVPLYALTRKTSIMKWRGSILTSRFVDIHGYGYTKVVPTIHPSATLRMYLYQYPAVKDLMRVLSESTDPEPNLPKRNIYVRPNFHEAMAYLEDCANFDKLGFDIEVMFGEVSCFAVAKAHDDVMCIPLIHRGMREYFDPEQETHIWLALAKLLENENIGIVGQNLSFDSTFLLNRFGIKTKSMEDTMVKAGVQFPDLAKGLDFLTSIYTREPYYKDEGKEYFKHAYDDEAFWRYNGLDASVVLEIAPKQDEELITGRNVETYKRQVSTIPALVYMGTRGIKVDRESLKRESLEAGVKIAEKEEELRSLCGFNINPRSPAQLKQYFYEYKGIKPYTKSVYQDGVRRSVVTTDEKAMVRIARRGFPEAQIILDIRHLQKLKGTYLDVNLDIDGRLRCSFNPVGTEFGRLSSSETIFHTGTNMQNLPPEFRKYMVADNNCVIYNIDLSQAENRIVAYIAPEPRMIEAFETNKDVHRLTASGIFNKAPEDISDEEYSADIGSGKYSERFWGKKSNHSFNYGLSPRQYSLITEIAEREAKFIHNAYHNLYPGIKQYWMWVKHDLSVHDRTLTNLMGRRRKFLDRWDDKLLMSAYSMIPQSSVADIINEHGVNFVYHNQGLFGPAELMLQIHDSIDIQVSLDYSWETHAKMLLAIKEMLETPLQWRGTEFVIPADCEMGLNYAKWAPADSKHPNPHGFKKVPWNCS